MRCAVSGSRGIGVLLLFTFGVAISAHPSPAKSPASASQAPRETEAAALVRQALEAEAAGNPLKRAELLKQALETAPDFGPAHWQSGELRQKNQWLTVNEVAEQASMAGTVAEYRRRRDLARNKAVDHLTLADWCASVGLTDQRRVHLLYAFHLHPTLPGVLGKLGLSRYDGRIISREQIVLLKMQAKRTNTQFKLWKADLKRMRSALESDNPFRRVSARRQLRDIRDPAAIPALESVFAGSPSYTAQDVIKVLAGMPEQAATDSLVRHAIFAPHEKVRGQAAEALKPRSLFGYVPMMMSALRAPIQVRFELFSFVWGYGHRLTLYQAGPTRDRAFVSAAAPTRPIRVHVTQSRRNGRRTSMIRGRKADADTSFEDGLLATQARHHNLIIEQLNGRTTAALEIATGNDLGADPTIWWNWWYDYNEVYRPPYKPVDQQTRFANTAGPILYTLSYSSCFVAGTPVWTLTGPAPIEKIRIGESVLAQQPETGELCFKPVLATTVRPSGPVVEIHVGEDVIRATRGHPFWVSGIGWQMAKELRVGQWLHTARGPLCIESVEETGEAKCYNMVVADYNTYFIGNEQVLVHDNNLRSVTTAVVPGLVAGD